MKSIRASLTVLAFLISFCASAKEVTDTLYSAKNDRIIVTYSITQIGNKVDLQFKNVRKMLGDYHRNKYKEIDKINILFFDWIGVRKDIKFTGETPSAVAFPAKATYKKSSDGYFIVEQKPYLTFDIEPNGATSFSIPLYLAHYEGKQHYKILGSCGNLEVQFPGSSTQPSTTGKSTGKSTGNKKHAQQSSTEFIETEEEISEFDDEALSLINSIMSSLPFQDTLPMEGTLERKVNNLVDLQSKIKNDDISNKIESTLAAYNGKKKELEKHKAEMEKQQADDNAFMACSTKEDFERYMKQHPNGKHVAESKAKVDELEAKAKQEEDSKKKRTIWMIIGGILLAILLFIGNQVLQSFRNKRTQRNMMQMQRDAVNKAKTAARNKAQGEIRKQTNKATGQVKKKGQTIIRGAANKAKNNTGNNRLSI